MNTRYLMSMVLVLGLALVGLALALSTDRAAAQGSPPGGLVLWNKLGSDDEVLNSEVGPGFGTRPGVIYVSGRFDGALATTGGTTGSTGGYLTMSPDDFFGADKTKGTVEVWIQKRILQFYPYTTPLVNIFGYLPYGGGYHPIHAFWSDGFTGNGGLQFQIRDSSGTWHVANDLAWDSVAVGQWVHVAFVWNLNGIEGSSDKLRIYRDGEIVAANAEGISGIWPDTTEVRILAHHYYSRFGQPTAYLDNIKVWDYAKIDYSDRFSEAPDSDGDGAPDDLDAFPFDPSEWSDNDGDGTGDNTDTDDDNDGQSDVDEIACGSDPLDASSAAPDADGDYSPDCVDADDDNDGYDDVDDAFPLDPSEWSDNDGDGTGDNGDMDDDNDGQFDVDEIACGSDPLDASSAAPDVDGDYSPDCVDADDDNDGVLDGDDNCPMTANPGQADNDGDGEGDACDPVASPGGPYLVAIGGTVVLDGSGSSDPDGGALAYAWAPADDLNDPAAVNPIYTADEVGVHTLTLTVTDPDGMTDSEITYVVVYDPEAGFVTGGGWIWSEPGWCQLDDVCAGAEGKANFGFVSKYKKGATVPTGNTEFQFKAGNLNFQSDSYQWLVVAGPKAMFKGEGTINGTGNYGFLISAVDEALTPSTDVDLFRIKIWDMDDGDAVVYDNQMDSEGDADPTTAIGGGSIVIHTGG